MKRILFLFLMVCAIPAVHAHEFPPESQITNLGECCELQATVRMKYSIRPKTTARLTFPVLATNDENDFSAYFNDAVDELLQKEVNLFRARAKQQSQLSENVPVTNKQNYLFVDYSTSGFRHADTTLLSVRFSLLEAKAALQERPLLFRSLNFNLKTGEILTLDSMFTVPEVGLNVISEYVKDTLSTRLKDDSILKLQGLTPTSDNFSIWNALPTGILFTFPRGQVLPESWGTQTVLVAYEVLDEVVDANAPLAMCVKHPRWCRSTLTLSGAFAEFKAFS